MKKSWIFIGLCSLLVLASCKSKESAYRKAYEKAKAAEMTTDNTNDNSSAATTAPVTTQTAPVQQAAPVDENVPVRSENVDLIDGEGLRAYSVVCGSFSLKTNAEGLQSRLKNAGYNAQIAYNSQANNGQGMYRVIASTYDDRSSAVRSRSSLRTTYPDAWLLLKK